MFGVDTATVKVTLWAGGVIVALLALVFARRPRRPRRPSAGDLGPISEQWMAEHKRGGDAAS
jgi:hypothetical protein